MPRRDDRCASRPPDVTATEVLGNIDAMLHGLERVAPGDEITVDVLLLEVRRRLLAGTRLEEHGGSFRSVQNWIGGSDYNPCSADFVPPEPEFIEGLIGNLVAFCNGEALPPVAQAAVAHAQFETIHPFVDGNGRTGRAMIHLVLRRTELHEALSCHDLAGLVVLAFLARDLLTRSPATREWIRSPTPGAALRERVESSVGSPILVPAACTRAVADQTTSVPRRRLEAEAHRAFPADRIRSSWASELLLRLLARYPGVDSPERRVADRAHLQPRQRSDRAPGGRRGSSARSRSAGATARMRRRR